MSPKGGKREGAGRKSIEGEPLLKVAVTLSKTQIARLKKLGNGNLSAGIRTLIDNTPGE